MDLSSQNSKRLTNLETTVMHLQSDYDALNSVVLENSKRLEEIRVLLERLLDQMQNKKDEPPRSLEDEKPPHY